MDVAVIAHGWLGDQLASERDVAEAERIIATNFTSVVALLVPLGNHFEAAGAGNIAVLSSVAGDRGRPRNYTYGAAKGALNVYLQGLRTRLWSRGVRVQTLKLGPVDTPMTATHTKNLLFARADPSPPASSPRSTRAAPRSTSPGSGAHHGRGPQPAGARAAAAAGAVGPLARGVRAKAGPVPDPRGISFATSASSTRPIREEHPVRLTWRSRAPASVASQPPPVRRASTAALHADLLIVRLPSGILLEQRWTRWAARF